MDPAPVLLRRGRILLGEAAASADDGERFRLAHLAALRAAAAVIAERRQVAGRRRLMNVWVVLPRVAPEYAEQAAYFASGARASAAVAAGATGSVTRGEADEQLAAATDLFAAVEAGLSPYASPLAG